MRITKLALISYGAFENRSVPLRTDARLHVVYGPNEAGKSTMLAAVRDLLFGFPMRTNQDFRFRQQELRVGGEVLSRAGASLSFVRRKGNRNTLLDPEGRALADDALAPFLGQMTRDIFSGAFGLDAECLRKGADDLLQARGEVGSSLMAAASGLRGLASLRKELDEAADGIFAANKSQARRFYQARDRFDLAKKAIAERELRGSAWEKIREAVTDNRKRVEALRGELRDVRAERTRIERLKALSPLLRRLDAAQQVLAEFADLSALPDGFIDELGAALAQDAEALRALERATQDVETSARALEGIAIDRALLDRAPEIEALVQRVGKHQKDSADLPRVAGERDGAEADLDRHALLLGLADARALAAAQPTHAGIALVRDLAQQGQQVAQTTANFEISLREERDLLERVEAELARHAHLVSPAPLREKLAALGNVEALVSACSQKAQTLRRDEEALRQEAAALVPPIVDLAVLASAAIPSKETIESFAARFDQASALEREAALRTQKTEHDLDAVRLRIEALSAGGDVPTPERIAAARADRDSAWGLLRPALFGEPGAPSGATLAALVTRFEVAGAHADALADDAARDAARVADYAAQTSALERRLQEKETLRREGDDLRAARQALEAEWSALWSGLPVQPLAPSKMQAWRAALANLLARYGKLADARLDLAHAQSDLNSLSAPLAAIAVEAGLAPMEIDIARQAVRIATRLRELSTAWDEARATASRRQDIEARIAKLTRDLAEARVEQAKWTASWRKAVPGIGLPSEAGIPEALAAIDAWKLVPQMLEKRDDLARRVAGLHRDIGAFESDAQSLIEAIAPDLASLPPGTGVAHLNRRLEQARSDAARADIMAKRKREGEEAHEQAFRASERARVALATLAARLPGGADPVMSLQRLKDQEQAKTDLENFRRQFEEQANGLGEDEIRAELAGFDPDRAAADLASLAQSEERMTQESNEAYAELKKAEQQVEALEAGIGSEAAWQQRMNAEAEMQEAAREWLVLRLASTMLNNALESHRASRQDPLMQRASEIFATLTGGAFSGVTQSFGDEDEAVLLGRRSTGEAVGVAGLSEGTRDQLYLALRLAYVEDYATRAEPVPFIADDLFASFDDARTAHGLRALADTGANTQCILFTHHRHVIELARAQLAAEADIVEL